MGSPDRSLVEDRPLDYQARGRLGEMCLNQGAVAA